MWSQGLPGGIHSSPVTIDGTVYVASATGDPPFCVPGQIDAFNERSGTPTGLAWLTDPTHDNGGGIWAPLSTDGTSIYFGTGNTCDGSLTAQDGVVSIAASALKTNWVKTAGAVPGDDDVGGALSLHGSTGYVETKSGSLYAFNTATGAIVWTKYLGAPDGFGGFATPTLAANTVVISAGYATTPGSGNPHPGGMLDGLDPNTGALKWTIKTQNAVLTSASATPDLSFVGLDDSLAAVDPATGRVLWSHPTAALLKASAALGPSGVFAADLNGEVYAFRP